MTGDKDKMDLTKLINDIKSTSESTEATVNEIKELLLGDPKDPSPDGLVHRVQMNTQYRMERMKNRGFWKAALVTWMSLMSISIIGIALKVLLGA